MPIRPQHESRLQALVQGCPADNPLATYYQDFQVQSRVLLTGHSHQAWPDCAKQGILEAYQDAALHVDDKWERAMQKAQRVREGFAQRLDDPNGEYVLGQNVHELALRCLSSLPAYATPSALARKAPILSSDAEFHSLHRQLERWREYGLTIERVAYDLDLVPSLCRALEQRPNGYFGAIVVSAVSYSDGLWAPGFEQLARAATWAQTPLIIDAYHAVNVVPFSMQEQQLGSAYVLGGGYKYCQLGEGVCFLRIPQGLTSRPAITGWFAQFEAKDRSTHKDTQVAYAPGAQAFAGSTYDPTSHYRAAKVFDFFDEQVLDVPTLRAINQRQIKRLIENIQSLAIDPAKLRIAQPLPDTARAGFLALHSPLAPELCRRLRTHQVWADARGKILRLGPAPYLSDPQLDQAIQALDKSLSDLS